MTTYRGWPNVPEGLATKTTLKKEGLRLARGQQPVAQCFTQYGSKRNYYDLYDKSQAVPKPPATEKQLAAIAKAQAASLAARTCKRCGYIERLSEDYRNKYKVNKSGYCDGCEQEIACEQDHNASIDWAKALLADEKAIIVDCETCDLYGEIIELSIINMHGEMLFSRRFKPISEITQGALDVHGITAEMLADEPSFADCESELRTILSDASQIIFYNQAHDAKCLKVTRKLHGVAVFGISDKYTCAMVNYAAFVGDYSSYYEDYKYQPLCGDHTALGDCRATLSVLKEMARGERWGKEESGTEVS